MTRKRRYLISAAVIVACACIALGVLAMLPQPGVTKANFERIKDGMTRAEVEKILGSEWIDLSIPSGRLRVRSDLVWRNPDGSHIIVAFDDDAVVITTLHKSTETILDKLRRWLHLPK